MVDKLVFTVKIIEQLIRLTEALIGLKELFLML